MTSTVEISPQPVPAEAFDLYPDRWVAVHDGHVVADAETLEELEADSRVEQSDTKFRVPPAGAKFF